ncbi:hypothetical protein AJ78_01760 [Emergomyces pasteurianus Ep9510]|uniref:Uncharacterized protein n=1 Tax=Emergomyces pasteurianus Ep9510 TaxID=1447872 RepID=A0A1J9PQM4_9EURO|nr:hypothetical protein AJ78_01760 [Emergomyces pasteurianus Ep9510]
MDAVGAPMSAELGLVANVEERRMARYSTPLCPGYTADEIIQPKFAIGLDIVAINHVYILSNAINLLHSILSRTLTTWSAARLISLHHGNFSPEIPAERSPCVTNERASLLLRAILRTMPMDTPSSGTLPIGSNSTLLSTRQRYGNLLTTTLLPADPFPASPPQTINAENTLKGWFQQLHATHRLAGLTSVGLDVGEAAVTPGGFKPDTAYYALALAYGTGPNRAPGDIKPSWKWNTALRTGYPNQRAEFKQALSQVNYYMNQHKTRYGFLITNLELVAIRRLDNNGSLELSTPIPWEAQGTATQPRLTVLLALWYIGMLAAQDEGAEQWHMD